MTRRIGVAALGRSTFDVPFAEQMCAQAFSALDAAGFDSVGPRNLLYDADAAMTALDTIKGADDLEFLLLLQVTFTDATMTAKLVEETGLPAAMWAIPEPRLGGRLRLNAYCGLNLAAHALGRRGIPLTPMYADPTGSDVTERLARLSGAKGLAASAAASPAPGVNTSAEANRIIATLRGANISVIGQHPAGFDTCAYDAERVRKLAGVEVTTFPMSELFDTAKGIDANRVARVREGVASDLQNLDDMDQTQLDRSLRLFCGLQDIQAKTGAAGMAVRCWPETFTEYGCAACGPMAMMSQRSTPCACEADVYGTLSTLMLQAAAQEPVWMADLVDVDEHTGVFWHCGLAPMSMCDPEASPEATIHTNRKMPLLHQFPLKPGRITIMRISQARNEPKMTLAGAEVQRAPMAFTGTSGVVVFDQPTEKVAETIVREGLEHHYAIAYGDHRPILRTVADRLGLPVLELA